MFHTPCRGDCLDDEKSAASVVGGHLSGNPLGTRSVLHFESDGAWLDSDRHSERGLGVPYCVSGQFGGDNTSHARFNAQRVEHVSYEITGRAN